MKVSGRQHAIVGSIAESALEVMPAAVAVVDRRGVVVAANAVWRTEDAYPVGSNILTGPVDDDTRELLVQSLARVLDRRSSRVELEISEEERSGRRWNLVLLGAIDEGRAVLIRVDVTTAHDLLDVLTEASLRDSLTMLPNRALLQDRITSAIARTERDTSAHVVLFIDLNRFKTINDTHGHGVGDHVLTAVARRLSRSLRAADSVGRWGGDEFVVILEAEPSEDPATFSGVVNRIVDAVGAPIEVDGIRLRMGVSIGAVAVRPGDSVRDLVGLADAAMYRAKTGHVPIAVAQRDRDDLHLDITAPPDGAV